MKQLKIALVLLEVLCIFTLSGCLNGESGTTSTPASGETIAKPIEQTPTKKDAEVTKDETAEDIGLSPESVRLKPRDGPSTDLEKITLKNGLVISVPKSEVSGINSKAMKSQANKPEVIGSYKRSFTIFRKPKPEGSSKSEESSKTKGGKVKAMSAVPVSPATSGISESGIISDLGLPYDSFTKTIINGQVSCLSDELSEIFLNPNSITSFKEYNNQDSLYNEVDASLGIEAGVGPVASVSVTGSFLSSGQADAKSTNIYYIFRDSRLAKLGALKDRSNPLDSLRVAYGATKAFRGQCGDSYVSEANAGILMIVRLRLGFNSGIDKTEFALALNASIGSGLADVSAKITKAMVQTNIKVSLTIDAMQLGGDWMALPKVMGIQTDNIPPDVNGMSSVNCVMGVNVEQECKQTITDIYNYAKTLENQSNGPGSYYYDQLKSTLYSEGLFLSPSVEDKVLEGRIKEFSLKYDQVNQGLKLISDFNLRYTTDTRSELAVQLQQITNKLSAQINDVFYVLELQTACYNKNGVYPSDSCNSELDLAYAKLELKQYKLSPTQAKLLTDYLPKQQFRVGGLGLPRGDRGIGVCYLVPITLASDKNVYFKLDCGLGAENPVEDISVKSVNDKQIVINDFSYTVGNPAVKVQCAAAGGGSELVFSVDEVGDTYTAKGAVCKKNGIPYSTKDEKDLVLQRIKD